MIEKTPRQLAFLTSEFNAFLFASIGIDRGGSQLSVVSALGRLDLDPWDEAEKLSRLPDTVAAQKLAIVMSRLPEITAGQDERGSTAKRLVALLPHHVLGKITAQPMRSNNAPASVRLAFPYLAIIFAAILAGQIIWHMQQPAHTSSVAHSITSPVTAPNSAP